jgi:hypothetical protein
MHLPARNPASAVVTEAQFIVHNLVPIDIRRASIPTANVQTTKRVKHEIAATNP